MTSAPVKDVAGIRFTKTGPGRWGFNRAPLTVQKHRRLDVGALLVGLVALGLLAAAGLAWGGQERVASYWVGARVTPDGRTHVTEVIDYDFASNQRHGIFRDVPDVAPGTPVTASSTTAPDDVDVTWTGSTAHIRIGVPDKTISGRHRYTVEYTLDGAVAGGQLRWDAVGTGWEVPIDRASVHVAAPWSLADARCWQGTEGSTGSCSAATPAPGRLDAEASGLGEGKGLTVAAALGSQRGDTPALPSPAAPAAGTSRATVFALALGAALVAAALTSRLVRRAGREWVAPGGATDAAWGGTGAGSPVRCDAAELADLATTEFSPPAGVSPAQGGVVLAEAVSDEHRAAWLMQAAIDGYAEVEWGSDPRLVRGDRRDGPTGAILDEAFAGRDRLPLGVYDSSFAAAWDRVGRELDGWSRTSGLWDQAAERRRRRVRRAGIVTYGVAAAATFFVAALVRGVPGGLVAVGAAAALGGAGWACFVRGWELRSRTPAGSAVWLRTESFRRFLAESEAHHAAEAAERGVLREYTAWAVAIGEIERWTAAVQGAGEAVTSARDCDWVDNAWTLPAMASMTAAGPSSGGDGSGGGYDGGFDGGDSVGGGSGGGGGGSW